MDGNEGAEVRRDCLRGGLGGAGGLTFVDEHEAEIVAG